MIEQITKEPDSRLDRSRYQSVIVQAVAAIEVHLKIRQLRYFFNRRDELASARGEWIDAKVVINNQTQPQSQLANLYGLLLKVHSIETVLNHFLFRPVQPLAPIYSFLRKQRR